MSWATEDAADCTELSGFECLLELDGLTKSNQVFILNKAIILPKKVCGYFDPYTIIAIFMSLLQLSKPIKLN